MWHFESKLKPITWTLLVTKNEFRFKSELDYQIKPLKHVFFFNNFSGDLNFVFCCLDYRALLDFPSYVSESWRGYTFKGVF